ncbi:MAG: hypothetical protein N0A16_05590 [Blastocatellia bacterium]|nr:hypothetical protein [Blastocatellia bacterium]MCS7157181.1 hypothetical protein [Blastocatellia bacterium]MCX7752356.1 hypothetical protein [Blastocatellia bacterium]MDW8167237.1 hypothetical protein [Acidobacteriota bacterium]
MMRSGHLSFAMKRRRSFVRPFYVFGEVGALCSRWRMIAVVALLLMGRAAAGSSQEFRLPARHDHAMRSCQGELILTSEGIEYRTAHSEHARRWAFEDVRLIVLASRREITLHTYEAHWWTLGRDRVFRFTTLSEIPEEVSAFLLAHISRPLATSFVVVEEKSLHEFPARHRHRLGGCQGTIRVYADRIVYDSRDRPRDSRSWRWSDIQRVGRFGPYLLEIVTYEPEFGGPTRAYVFDLKASLPDEVYDFVWGKVYRIVPRVGEEGR